MYTQSECSCFNLSLGLRKPNSVAERMTKKKKGHSQLGQPFCVPVGCKYNSVRNQPYGLPYLLLISCPCKCCLPVCTSLSGPTYWYDGGVYRAKMGYGPHVYLIIRRKAREGVINKARREPRGAKRGGGGYVRSRRYIGRP